MKINKIAENTMRIVMLGNIFLLMVGLPLWAGMSRSEKIPNFPVALQPDEAIERSVTVTNLTGEECPVLGFKARLETPKADGCQVGLQVMIDDAAIMNIPPNYRLLNKPPAFTSPTQGPTEWYSPRDLGWVVAKGPDFIGTGGKDDFLLDLDGLAKAGAKTTITFKNISTLPFKNTMAGYTPLVLVLDKVVLGVMTRAEMKKVRRASSGLNEGSSKLRSDGLLFLKKNIFGATVILNPGQEMKKTATIPAIAKDETVILKLKARLESRTTGGANYALRLSITGRTFTESPLRTRLLNKPSQFTPSGLNKTLDWYSAADQGWMLITGPNYEGTWAGTGQDYDFWFDLTGLVSKNEPVAFAFKSLMTQSNPALVMLDEVVVAVMKRSEVEKLQGQLSPTGFRETLVDPVLPAKAKPGPRPYEIIAFHRTETPPAQVAFDNLKGWTLRVYGDADVSLSASVDHPLWRKLNAKLSYAGGTKNTTAEIRPPSPIEIKEPFDVANLIIYGAFGQDIRPDLNTGKGLGIFVLLEDSAGVEFTMDLGEVKGTYWDLCHGMLQPAEVSRAKFPMKFKAILISNCNISGKQNAYLESLTFYKQNRKPIKRLKLENPIYPINDDGILPTPPSGVKVRAEQVENGVDFVSETDGNVLRFFIRPAERSLNGVTARWNNGKTFRPMEGGGLRLKIKAGEVIPGGAGLRMLSSKLENGVYTVRWRYLQTQWEERYWLRGRTLGVDLSCPGGNATGINYGLVAGLRQPKGIEVPYLTYGAKPGPWIGYGDGLFISVLPDWYHSDFSQTLDHVTEPDKDRIGLLEGTLYVELTDGRRNDLRERILVTVSPEFAETLPNSQNPPSPNRELLAPYMYVVEYNFLETFYRNLKRYGVDYVIANHFSLPYLERTGENFAARWTLQPGMTKEILATYQKITKDDLGYMFATYLDYNHLFMTSEYWDENRIALWSDGNWTHYWPGAYQIKDVALPYLARDVGQKAAAHLPPFDNAYMDEHSNRGLYAIDHEAGVEGAGIARVQVMANADCIVESRKWYRTITSEGKSRWLYAGLTDMDYATITTEVNPICDLPLLVDFDLLKIHPLSLGTMMSYAPSYFLGDKDLTKVYQDTGLGEPPEGFYRYVSASLGYGHMLIAGYGQFYPKFSRLLQFYCLMQGIQKEYLPDTVTLIQYHNGSEYLPSSKALADDSYRQGRVCVRYKRGLRVQVNYNKDKNWQVEVEGIKYDLPPFGWVIDKPREILAFSALINGKRVDYVSCPQYVYLNSNTTTAQVKGLDVEGAVWVKREGAAWRLIPCGYLGTGNGMYPLAGIPADRGCKRLIISTQDLMNKKAGEVNIQARDYEGKKMQVKVKILDNNRLQIFPDVYAVDYLLQ
ncbi:MAG: hypothetical protein WC975_09285 [Phycisphaerae bacterium]